MLTFKVGNSETLNIKTPSFARFPTGPGCAWLHTSKSILRRRRGRGHAHHGHVPRREHGSGSLGIRGFGRVVEGEGPAWLIDFRLKECSIWNMFYIYILYVCIYEHINFYSCIFIIFIYRYRKNDIEIYIAYSHTHIYIYIHLHHIHVYMIIHVCKGCSQPQSLVFTVQNPVRNSL